MWGEAVVAGANHTHKLVFSHICCTRRRIRSLLSLLKELLLRLRTDAAIGAGGAAASTAIHTAAVIDVVVQHGEGEVAGAVASVRGNLRVSLGINTLSGSSTAVAPAGPVAVTVITIVSHVVVSGVIADDFHNPGSVIAERLLGWECSGRRELRGSHRQERRRC